MGNLVSRVCIPLLHWFRLFGWAPSFFYLLYRFPLKGAAGVLFYYLILSRLRWWKRLVCWFTNAGFDPRFHFIDASAGTVDFTRSRYLVCAHPHGLYVDGALYSIVFQKAAFEANYPGLNYKGAGADQVSYLPLFREVFDGDKGKLIGVSKRELLEAFAEDPSVSIGMCPGGFSEAVFTDARNSVEYSYLKGRKGFIKLAIQAGVDIIPLYQFNVGKLYKTPRVWRGLRARLAQRFAIPMVIWSGWMGTSQPLDDTQVYTVLGPVFPASQYSLAELDKAHADYCAALQRLYDAHKAQFGMADVPLVFIGKDFHDNDVPSRVFRRLGVHTSHVIPGTEPHKQQLREIQMVKRHLRNQEAAAAQAAAARAAGKGDVNSDDE